MPEGGRRLMELDDALKLVGEMGHFQYTIFACLFMVGAFHGARMTSGYYFVYDQGHTCQIPPVENNTLSSTTTHSQWTPKEDNPQSARSCKYNDTQGNYVPCHSWKYDTSVMKWTATRKYDLVCDKKLYSSHANMALMLGSLIGAVGFGKVSDRYGRKVCFHSAAVLFVAFGVGMGWSPNFYVFAITYGISAAASTGLFIAAIVTAMEFVLPKHRKIPGLLMNAFFPIGEMLTTAIAYGIRDWTLVGVVISAPAALMLLYYWIVPESIRWLMIQKQYRKMDEILQKMARINGKEVYMAQQEADNFEELLQSGEHQQIHRIGRLKQDSFFHLFKHCNLALRFCFVNFNWFVVNLSYFGLLYSSTDLGQGLFMNCFYGAVVEAPAHILSLLLVDSRTGRKGVHCFYYVLVTMATAISIVVTFQLEGNKSILLVMTMVGKFGAAGLTGTSFLWMTEIYPTSVRTTSLGIGAAFARIGGIVSYYIVETGKSIHSPLGKALPYIVICVFGALAFICCVFLPETSKKTLPSSIEDAHQFGRNQQGQRIVTVNYGATDTAPLLDSQ